MIIVREKFNPRTYRFEEVERFEDAHLREMGDHHDRPGHQYWLHVPSPDPETGTMEDVDGDSAYAYLEMIGADARISWDTPAVTGFVSTASVKNFRARIDDGEYGGAPLYEDYEYHMERWSVWLPDELVDE